MLKNTKILVTGGAGYIGSHAVLALLDQGCDVTVIDNLSTGFRWAIPKGAVFFEGDIGDQAFVEELLLKKEITGIMHFAGSIIVPESVKNPLLYYSNNSSKSRSLIESAVKCGVENFIFSSTAATYGIPDISPISESSPKRPINPYGMSKLITEVMLGDVANAHPITFCVLRYFNVAGADPSGRSGQSTEGATHLIKVAVEAVLGKREYVAVFGEDFDTPDGTGVRDYIHVSDLADAHLLALEYLVNNPGKNLTLNCGYGKGFSVKEVLSAVDQVTGKTLKRKIQGRRDGDPDSLISDSRLIMSTLPWQPKYTDIRDIISHALMWEQRLKENHGR